MIPLIITETDVTPYVYFNNKEGKLLIAGKSLSKNANSFYASVNTWLENYLEKNTQKTELHIIFESIDTNTHNYLFHLLKILEKYFLRGTNILVKWYHQEGDQKTRDLFSHLRMGLKIPIKEIIID